MDDEIWRELEIEPTTDEAAIKRAYVDKLKQTRPEDDPEGFKRLRAAYEAAQKLAAGQWLGDVGISAAAGESASDQTAVEPVETSDEPTPRQRASELCHSIFDAEDPNARLLQVFELLEDESSRLARAVERAVARRCSRWGSLEEDFLRLVVEIWGWKDAAHPLRAEFAPLFEYVDQLAAPSHEEYARIQIERSSKLWRDARDRNDLQGMLAHAEALVFLHFTELGQTRKILEIIEPTLQFVRSKVCSPDLLDEESHDGLLGLLSLGAQCLVESTALTGLEIRRLLRELEELADVSDAPAHLAYAKMARAYTALIGDRVEESISSLKSAVHLAADGDDRVFEAVFILTYAQCLLYAGRYRNAEKVLRTPLEIDFLDPLRINLLGFALLRADRDVAEAVERAEKGLELAGSVPDSTSQLAAFNLAAEARLASGDLLEARQANGKAIHLTERLADPYFSVEPHLTAARLAAASGEFDDSRRHLDEVRQVITSIIIPCQRRFYQSELQRIVEQLD